MSFWNLGPALVIAGLGALAGALFLLQRLRVRHREVVVPTTLFWRQAVEEARARVLWRRFRHLWAYLLVLAICSLLWLGVAEPRAAAGDGRDFVLLLDGSAGMARGDRFARGVASLRERLAELPSVRTTVRLCGKRTRTLLRPGEEPALLERRLAGLSPDACPSGIERELRTIAAARRDARPVSVLVFGGAPLDPFSLDLLPDSIRAARVDVPAGAPELPNRGITALGVTEARSGAHGRVDVLVEVYGAEPDGPGDLSVALGDDALGASATAEREPAGPGRTRFLLRDLPARGELLRVRLIAASDALALDDEAAVRLPRRAPIRVALSARVAASVEIARALRMALDADQAVQWADAEADVVVRFADEPADAGPPALVLVAEDAQEHAILSADTAERPDGEALQTAFERLGLGEIDATSLAEQAARPITLGVARGAVRSVAIWSSLCTDRYDFVQSRAFPMFVARALRWLAGEQDMLAWAAAGDALPERFGALADADGARLDPAGAPFTPPAAGRYSTDDGETIAVSLLDPATTEDARSGEVAGGTEDASGAIDAEASPGRDLLTAVLLAALALLLVEWVLYRKGRIP